MTSADIDSLGVVKRWMRSESVGVRDVIWYWIRAANSTGRFESQNIERRYGFRQTLEAEIASGLGLYLVLHRGQDVLTDQNLPTFGMVAKT
jgi:hypothetical protein